MLLRHAHTFPAHRLYRSSTAEGTFTTTMQASTDSQTPTDLFGVVEGLLSNGSTNAALFE